MCVKMIPFSNHWEKYFFRLARTSCVKVCYIIEDYIRLEVKTCILKENLFAEHFMIKISMIFFN